MDAIPELPDPVLDPVLVGEGEGELADVGEMPLTLDVAVEVEVELKENGWSLELVEADILAVALLEPVGGTLK